MMKFYKENKLPIPEELVKDDDKPKWNNNNKPVSTPEDGKTCNYHRCVSCFFYYIYLN